MRKNFLFFIAIVSFTNTFAQNVWTKSDRNGFYDDCMGKISKYTSLTMYQKESICLCYIDDLTKKYDKNELNTKIDVEIERIFLAITNQCSKNLGINLQVKETPKVEEKVQETATELKYDKMNFIGTWFSELGEYTLSENGEFILVIPNRTKPINGKWYLDGSVVFFRDLTSFGKIATREFKIISVKKNDITMSSGNQIINFKRK